MMLLPIPAVIGVSCLIAFVIVMARPPHTFTSTAQTLLIAFLVFYFGAVILGAAWYLFVEQFMYHRWLASFENDWVDEDRGWWRCYVGLERWLGRLEHAVYTCIKNGIRALQKALTTRSKNSLDEGQYTETG